MFEGSLIYLLIYGIIIVNRYLVLIYSERFLFFFLFLSFFERIMNEIGKNCKIYLELIL